MSKEKQNEYAVWADVQRTVIVKVSAKSLEEATEKARLLDEDEFVTVNGEHIDGEFEITGVLKS